MTSEDVTRYILDTFPGVELDTTTPDTFFFVDPKKMMPFATIVTQDNDYDQVSNLNRPGVYRLNIGVGKETFHDMFGSPLAPDFDAGRDMAALNELMPHWTYGKLFWVSVLNPEGESLETVKTLLAEAYAVDVRTHARRAKAKGD